MSKKSSKSAKRNTRPKCENCGSKDVLPILYGYPLPEALEEYEKAEREHRLPPFELGGCCVTDNDPRWRCHACGHEFGFPKGKRSRDDSRG